MHSTLQRWHFTKCNTKQNCGAKILGQFFLFFGGGLLGARAVLGAQASRLPGESQRDSAQP